MRGLDISKTKSVTPHFFVISDIGNSLSDCSKSMKKSVLLKIFVRMSLSPNGDENEISLYIHYLFKHSSNENKGSDHQG